MLSSTFLHDIGLQLGQLMLGDGMDYKIFEKSAEPGSFYKTYPVHRKLISLNKRFTGTVAYFTFLLHRVPFLSDDTGPDCFACTNLSGGAFYLLHRYPAGNAITCAILFH